MACKLTQSRLRELLTYCPETGVFTWKNPTCNSLKPGDTAGATNSQGYRSVSFQDYGSQKNHRLAFLYMTGSIPDFVDHINGNKDDNRWCNLRPATKSQNAMNRKVRSLSQTGIKGVTWHKQSRRWRAYIFAEGKLRHLGNHRCPLIAHAAYRQAARELFGPFANFG